VRKLDHARNEATVKATRNKQRNELASKSNVILIDVTLLLHQRADLLYAKTGALCNFIKLSLSPLKGEEDYYIFTYDEITVPSRYLKVV
jgi:hypothetical protein